MKLVEEAARALAQQACYRIDRSPRWPDGWSERNREQFREDAAAVLQVFLIALRQPVSHGMERAYFMAPMPAFKKVLSSNKRHQNNQAKMRSRWSAMVAERVKEWGE